MSPPLIIETPCLFWLEVGGFAGFLLTVTLPLGVEREHLPRLLPPTLVYWIGWAIAYWHYLQGGFPH